MAGMPYLLLCGVGVWVYRGLRRRDAALLAEKEGDASSDPHADFPSRDPGDPNPGGTA